jgi:hypothetical protein
MYPEVRKANAHLTLFRLDLSGSGIGQIVDISDSVLLNLKITQAVIYHITEKLPLSLSRFFILKHFTFYHIII